MAALSRFSKCASCLKPKPKPSQRPANNSPADCLSTYNCGTIAIPVLTRDRDLVTFCSD